MKFSDVPVVILIDEPELSLHVRWQDRKLIDVTSGIRARSIHLNKDCSIGNNGIIATHSIVLTLSKIMSEWGEIVDHCFRELLLNISPIEVD